MKKIAIAIAALGTVAAPGAFAQYDSGRDYRDENRYSSSYQSWRDRDHRDARVIETRPLYAAGQGREECWNERAGHYEQVRDNNGETRVGKGAVIGAIAGGVLGHQLGSGRGNTAATAGGAVLGGLLGHNVEKRNDRDDQPDLDRTRCRVIADNGARPLGYDVRYEYDGREYVTRMDHEPGRTLRIGRDVRDDGSPLDDTAPYRERYGQR